MSNAAQIAANQANAEHSTGPRTEQGKSVASKNSTKHGFTGTAILIAGESLEAFEAHLQEYIGQHNPATIDEHFLVRQMSAAMWRINRLHRFEAAIFDKAPDGNPFADPILSAELLKLNRYEKSLQASYFQAAKELLTIRKDQSDTVKKEEKEEAAAVKAEKKQQAAELSAALDEIMYGPLPDWKDTREIGPDGHPTKRTQSGKEAERA